MDPYTSNQTFNQASRGGRFINLQAETAGAVTKSDSTVLSPCTLFIGTAGNVTVDTVAGQTDVVFKNLSSSSILPVLVVKVKAATTAADIVAIY